MSNVDGENPELDDLEMDEPGADQPDVLDEPDATLQFDEPGALPELEPTDDLLEPGDETVETDVADEPIQPVEDGFEEEADGLAPVEVKAEEEEEEPGEEEKEEEEEEEETPGLFARLTKTSPYVVLLGISVLAMLIAIFCLWMEFRRYDYEWKPPQVGAVPAVQSGPPSTTATA